MCGRWSSCRGRHGRERTDGEAPFLTTAAAACVSFQVFNLFDAAVVDIGLTVFQPRWRAGATAM